MIKDNIETKKNKVAYSHRTYKIALIKSSFAYIIIALFFTATCFGQKPKGATELFSPDATGILHLMVKTDSNKYQCKDIDVIKGNFTPCDSNPYIAYQWHINRNEIDSNWIRNLLRINEDFPDVSENKSEDNWLVIENRSSQHYKEDFIASIQKNGITFRHHESVKNVIGYNIANPNGKAIEDESKFHLQYDWEQNVKGKYESFYMDGKKSFRHKYAINKFITLSKDASNTKKTLFLEAQMTGSIEAYHENGKKKSVLQYKESYILSQTSDDTEYKIDKYKRSGLRITYYKTGKIFSTGAINEFGFDGKVEYFSKKGKTIKVENYENGVLNGKFEDYYPNGILKTKGSYKLGEKSGKWVEYNNKGEKVKTAEF